MAKEKFRVLVDWDNDGFVNVGVLDSAPINIIPHAAYLGGLYRSESQGGSFIESDNEPEIDIDELGLVAWNIPQTGTSNVAYLGITAEALTAAFYRPLDCSISLTPSTEYTIVYYLKSSTSQSVNKVVQAYHYNTSTVTDLVNTTITVGTEWTRVQQTFTSPSVPSGLVVSFNAPTGTTVGIKGVMLVEGAVGYKFSVGENAGYDDISNHVLSANWKLGRGEYDDPLAYEGTAEIVLNNDSRIFSPANAESPLYGLLRQNIMVKLQIEISVNNWLTVWTGWSESFETQTGRTSNRQATLTCNQGLFRLREGSLDYKLEAEITATEAIKRILDSVGFRSAYVPHITSLGYQAYLGVTTFLQDIDLLFSRLDESNRTMQLIGKEWGRKTTPEEALKNVLIADHAKMWVARDGSLVLSMRESEVNPEADYTYDLGVSAQAAEYTYGKKIVNRVEAYFDAPKERTNEVIWTTKEPIAIPAHVFGDGNQTKVTRYRELHFEFEEGTQRVITKINGEDISKMTVQVYNRNPRRYADPSPYEVSSGDWSGQVHATVLGSQNLRRQLQIRNNLEYPIWVDIEITGDYIEGGEGAVYVEEDETAQELITAVVTHSIELSEPSTEEEVLSYAKFILHRYAYPVGEFDSITFIDGDLSPTVGDILDLTEIQTAEENRKHIIIEESGSYSAGQVPEVVYTLARLDEQRYYAVGDTLEQSTLNVVQNLLDKMQPSASTYEKVAFLTDEGETAYQWNSGQANSGLLIFGNLEAVNVDMWGSSFDVTNNIHDFVNSQTEGFRTGIRKIAAPANPASVDFDFETEYVGSVIPVPQFIENGQYLISAGVKSLTGNNIVASIIRNDTGVSIGSQPTSTSPSHLRLVSPTFSVTPDTYKFLARSQSGAGLGTNDIAWGDVSSIHLPSLPTDELALEATTLYYLTIWIYAEINAASENIILNVVAEDGSLLLNTSVNIVNGFNKVVKTFTTGSSNNGKHGIIIEDAVGTSTIENLYFYGISITEQEPNTYEETNRYRPELPQVYL